jgi:cobalt-precorrin-5B (C1)-methyltransferase
VTLPGLPVPVGRAAINPVPLAQIERAACEAMEESGYTGRVRLVLEVEDGEAMARRTLNPRLGVVGGISILGTQGIVMPFSLEAWKATIDSGLEVARAAGCTTAAFATGRRGERLLMARRSSLPELAFIQAADFFAYATQRAVQMGFSEIVWGCFFGKLAKMAQGLPSTHAHASPTDFVALAELAGQAGADAGTCLEVSRANTARHALEIVPEGLVRERFVAKAAAKALEAARGFAIVASDPGAGTCQAASPRLGVCCFGFEGGVLAEAYTS